MEINAAQEDLFYWYSLAKKTVMELQHPVTGLIPAHPGSDTWVRDCTYAIHSLWALSLAFEKQLSESNLSVYHELKFRTIKGMRGLLQALMNQKEKVMKFNASQSFMDCLHAKYDTCTGKPVVGDKEWGHLQLDATSLYVLTLAQITSSGFVIVQSLSEVDFIQSLVLYIHYAYRTPDFGVYERGDKNNRGIRELSACSVGMAKAALVAIRDLNLFGAQGGPRSVICVPPDMSRQCYRVLEAILPRGSNSKEFDSSVWSVITYPAFAIESDELLGQTKELLKQNLEGYYGYKRFLLDGYQTALEDKNRLHYNLGELRNFEGIECEWPIYFIYEWIDELFSRNTESANRIRLKIEELMVPDQDGYPLVPEFYFVSSDKVEEEKSSSGSQVRLCGGKIPFIWAQSLFIVAGLLQHEFISASDIDPLNRRLVTVKKPASIVQIVVLSTNQDCQSFADEHNISCSPMWDSGIKIIDPSVVVQMWKDLGLRSTVDTDLNSPHSQRVSSLRSSIVYQCKDQFFLSLPEYALHSSCYSNLDNEVFIQKTIARLSYLSCQWCFPGRPLLAIMLTPEKCADKSTARFLDTLKSGSFQGVQVKLCNAQTALSTSFKQVLPSLPPLIQKESGIFKLASANIHQGIRKISTLPVKMNFHENSKGSLEPELLKLTGSTVSEKFNSMNMMYQEIGYIPDSLVPQVQDLYNLAAKERCWYILRHCSSFLHKVQPLISDSALHILVTQRQISFGEGEDEETIFQPPSPDEFLDFILRHSKKCKILFSIYQEVLNNLSQIMQKSPSLFKGILRIRLDLLVKLIAKETSGDENNFEKMCNLQPIEFYRLIFMLFSGGISVRDDEELTWERIRYIDGSLNRLPKNFHHNLYSLLNATSGIDLNGNVIRAFPLINEMTAGEAQFAISVSNWLDKIPQPQLRQLYVETIMILGSLLKMMKNVPDVIELHAILFQAHDIFMHECSNHDASVSLCGISEGFFLTPPTGQFGTLNYLSQAIAQFYY